MVNDPQTPQPDAALLAIAQEAAALALATAASVDDRTVATNKGPGDFATATDLAVEQAVADLLYRRTGLPVQGEERSPAEDAEVRWAVDPVDGTYNFAARLPLSAFSIGLMRAGEPVLGAVAHLASGQVASALSSGPLLVDGREVQPQPPTLGNGIIGCDISGKPNARHSGPFLAALLDQLWRHAGGVRMFATAAMELSWTAQGRIAGCILGIANAWDLAGGIALVRAAGGLVLDGAGQPWHEGADILIAAGQPATANDLAQLVADARSGAGNRGPAHTQ